MTEVKLEKLEEDQNLWNTPYKYLKQAILAWLTLHLASYECFVQLYIKYFTAVIFAFRMRFKNFRAWAHKK